MLKVTKNGRIYLTKGDSATINLDIQTAEGKVFTPNGGDKILFTVRNGYKKKDCAEYEFQLEIQNGILKIKPEHTDNMEYGRYVYDVQVSFSSGDIDTVLIGEIYITAEVT